MSLQLYLLIGLKFLFCFLHLTYLFLTIFIIHFIVFNNEENKRNFFNYSFEPNQSIWSFKVNCLFNYKISFKKKKTICFVKVMYKVQYNAVSLIIDFLQLFFCVVHYGIIVLCVLKWTNKASS